MSWAWALGMLILFIVPGIVGGGLVWTCFEKWTAVIVWEAVLLFLLSLLVSKGYGKGKAAH